MNVFIKAFGRQKTTSLRKREGFGLKTIPEYLSYYNQAINDYNSQNLKGALVNINKTIEKSDIDEEYDPNSNPYSMLAQIFSQAGQEDEAIHFLKIAAQLGNQYAQSILVKLGYF